MGESARSVKVEKSSNPEEDDFWVSFGKSLISDTIGVLDGRAQFMITTAASLLVVDFAALLFTSKIALAKISPQFFFAVSALAFVYSLFPRGYEVNPWTPDKTKNTYGAIVSHKQRAHVYGFFLFFIALILVAVTLLT